MDTHEVIPRAETLPTRQVLHPAVAEILKQSPTPEALERVLALQERWEAGEAKRAFTRALVELRRDLPAWIKRDQVVDFQGGKGRVHYTHASLAAAMEAVTPALTMHGFNLSWTPGIAPGGAVSVTATLTHRDGHSESATLTAPADMSGSKSPAQGVASTVTLLQRYTALSLLGIATSDMEEPKGNGSAQDGDRGRIDTTRNMRAMAAAAKAGRSKAEVEGFLGRAVQDWTFEDLEKLREWISPPKQTEPEPEAALTETEKPTDVRLVSKQQLDVLKGYLRTYKLAAADLGRILENECGSKPASMAQIPATQFADLQILFMRMAQGDIVLDRAEMRFKKPPADDGPSENEIPF